MVDGNLYANLTPQQPQDFDSRLKVVLRSTERQDMRCRKARPQSTAAKHGRKARGAGAVLYYRLVKGDILPCAHRRRKLCRFGNPVAAVKDTYILYYIQYI